MKEKTKEMADQVGAVYPTLFLGRHDGVLFTETELETFVNLVAAAEREACAKVCDAMEEKAEGTECCKWPTPIDCAHAIRARGTT